MKFYKKIVSKLTAILLMVGIFFSCSSKLEENSDSDIDWSKIDLSNIENLYAQPLPVIKKVVEGKWKVYVQYGGVVGISYPEDTYVEINNDHCITTNPFEQYSSNVIWKKLYVDYMECKTWVMQNKESDKGGLCFNSIKNDSLGVGSTYPKNQLMGSVWVRIKDI